MNKCKKDQFGEPKLVNLFLHFLSPVVSLSGLAFFGPWKL